MPWRRWRPRQRSRRRRGRSQGSGGLRLPIRPPRGQEDHPGVRCELTQSLSLSLSFDSIAFHSLSDLLVRVSQLRKQGRDNAAIWSCSPSRIAPSCGSCSRIWRRSVNKQLIMVLIRCMCLSFSYLPFLFPVNLKNFGWMIQPVRYYGSVDASMDDALNMFDEMGTRYTFFVWDCSYSTVYLVFPFGLCLCLLSCFTDCSKSGQGQCG